MNLLLDTHIFLWWRENSSRLTPVVREAVSGADVVYVSVASAWEISVKISIGRLRVPGPVEEAVEDSGFSRLPVTFAHAWALADLPLHHRDPFDRMLVAQARSEGLILVTADPKLDPYGVDLIRA